MQPDWKLGLLPMSLGFDTKAAPGSNGMNCARCIGTGATTCAQARDPRCSVEPPYRTVVTSKHCDDEVLHDVPWCPGC